jgi:hypothetical protein
MSGLVIRPYTDADLDRIEQMHAAQGFDYNLPDLHSPDFVIKAVIENGVGVDAGLLLRKTVETYLLIGAMTRKEGLRRLLIFEKELVPMLKAQGYTDVHCWVPPEIDDKFGKLLRHLGWDKEIWPSYSRKVK